MAIANHIFITGITGSLGSALAPLFLNEPNTYVYALIRARSAAHLQERVDGLFTFWGNDIKSANARSRLIAISGDASERNLGLPEGIYEELSAKITHVIHSAATIKLNMGEEEAIKKVLEPTKQIIAFTNMCRYHGTLKKLEYVSTIGVAGRMHGLIPETQLPDVQLFHNNYERFKSQAEALVFEKIHEGLPATLHRPSMIIGDSVTGKIIHFQGFYFLCEFLSGKLTKGVLPKTAGVHLDLIPSDYVAKAIYHSSHCSASIGSIFHLCAGPENAIPLHKFAEITHQYFKQQNQLSCLRYVPTILFMAALKGARMIAPHALKKTISNLGLFLEYLNDRQQFDNKQTQAFFQKWNLNVLHPTTYLERVFEYYFTHKK